MKRLPANVADFLSGRRIAVAGVSRKRDVAANFVFQKLRKSGYDVVPVNPNAAEVEGTKCHPDLASIPGELDGVVVATHPAASADVVRQAGARGVKRVWFHRSFGNGSVSAEALRECERLGIQPIVGGCPAMYCAPVDPGHFCMRWLLGLRGRVPR